MKIRSGIRIIFFLPGDFSQEISLRRLKASTLVYLYSPGTRIYLALLGKFSQENAPVLAPCAPVLAPSCDVIYSRFRRSSLFIELSWNGSKILILGNFLGVAKTSCDLEFLILLDISYNCGSVSEIPAFSRMDYTGLK